MTGVEWLDGVWNWMPAFSAMVSSIALVMTIINLGIYHRAAKLRVLDSAELTQVPLPLSLSVCIPARNEERNLPHILQDSLANLGVSLEVLAYDDQSIDQTPSILQAWMKREPRVRAVATKVMPAGWNGKQWGCEQMGQAARGEWLLFTDADVRFTPDTFARAIAEAVRLNASLLSTLPREEVGGFVERLVVPLIHWMLFSWLPMPRMRTTNDPATSAGCGQFLLVKRSAWQAAGGHAAFKESMHDGIKLPRNLRRAGFHTDLYDGSDCVSCRMYSSAGETWRGFTKNAYEGLGSPVVLLVFTLLEGAGILLPWFWLPLMIARGETPLGPTVLAAFAVTAQIVQRVLLARRFKQPIECVLLHPLTILLLLAIQWRSYWLHLTKQRAWRGRKAG